MLIKSKSKLCFEVPFNQTISRIQSLNQLHFIKPNSWASAPRFKTNKCTIKAYHYYHYCSLSSIPLYTLRSYKCVYNLFSRSIPIHVHILLFEFEENETRKRKKFNGFRITSCTTWSIIIIYKILTHNNIIKCRRSLPWLVDEESGTRECYGCIRCVWCASAG